MLSDTDAALLEIESQVWLYRGRKEAAIREATGLSLMQAMQRVNVLIDTEAAIAHDPITCRRLRAKRARSRRTRGLS